MELTVVIGLIVLLAAGIGLALGDSGGNSLATAQTTLASMVGSARAQAAVHQTKARVYVYGSRPPAGDAQKFLRVLQVFREEPAESGQYIPVASAAELPRGVYVVPPSVSGLLASGVIWPSNPAPLSAFATAAPQAIVPAPAAGTPFGGGMGYFIEFAPDGTANPAAAKLVVATAAIANNTPQFNNAAAVRGLLVRPTGAISFVNQVSGF